DGQWLLTGSALSDYNKEQAAAVIAFSGETDGNKELFTLKLKVKDTATASAAQISAVLTLNTKEIKCDAVVTDVTIAHSSAAIKASTLTPDRGDNVDLTLSLSDTQKTKSVAFELTYDDSVFEAVSGEWLIEGTLKDFDIDKKIGVIAFSDETDCNTDVFSLKLKVKEDAAGGSYQVSFKVLKSGEKVLCTAAAEITVPTASAPEQSFTLTTFGDSNEKVTIEVYSGNTLKTSFSITPDENGKAEIPLDQLEAGQYKFAISKANHVTREIMIDTSSLDEIADVKLHLKGDINGDGRVNTTDVGRANAHAKKTSLLEGYAFACADLNGDGRVNTTDVGRANAHAKKTNLIW
ncbi:MAG: hypothetical protein IKZ03_04130, partial [Clostridia bacterium]|nr:hypothetical protein [Clostridia bacterium]